MNWIKVIESLDNQVRDSSQKADSFVKRYGTTSVFDEHNRQIERHRINANICFALAVALKAGLEEE